MFVIFALLVAVLLLLLHRVRLGASDQPTLKSLGFALLVAACIAAPTIVLEATSDLWTPGTRWPMLMQFWSPFLFCSVLFFGLSKIPTHYWLPVWRGVIACAAAFVMLLVLGFNRDSSDPRAARAGFFRRAAIRRDAGSPLRRQVSTSLLYRAVGTGPVPSRRATCGPIRTHHPRPGRHLQDNR